MHIQRKKPPIRVQSQSRACDVVAALRGADEILGAILDPFDRPAKLTGSPQQHDPFGIQRVLDPKAAADIRGGDQDLVRWHAEHTRELVANGVDAGGGHEQMERVVFEASDRGAGFGGRDDQTVVDQIELNDVRGGGDRRAHGVGIALLETERQIAGHLVPQQRRTGCQSGRGIDDRRQLHDTSTTTRSAASRAAAAVSATTKATGSPTCRTRPFASAGLGGTNIGPTVATDVAQGSKPRSAMSS